jgi:hypothetical protein
MAKSLFCFIVMPFRSELNYFYLHLQHYLNKQFGIRVERGDHNILTKTLVDKVRDQIIESDFLIADITSGNPNVFYEVGLAHSFGKPVVFITQDNPANSPVDVRQFEVIQYELAHHEEFLSKLNNAVQNISGKKYQILYDLAMEVLKRFNNQAHGNYTAASLEEFQARVMRIEQTQEIPSIEDKKRLSVFLLPKIIQDVTDVMVMQKVMNWVGVTKTRSPQSKTIG